MPSGIKLKWTGKNAENLHKRTMLTRGRKEAHLFINQFIPVRRLQKSRKKVREKKYFEFIKLNNPALLAFLLHYAPLRHNSNFLNILYMSFRCFVRLPMQASMQGCWELPLKRKQSIAERWKSQRSSALACECSPASLGSPSCVCVCVQMCSSCVHASVSKCMHIRVYVWVWVCVRAHARFSVYAAVCMCVLRLAW